MKHFFKNKLFRFRDFFIRGLNINLDKSLMIAGRMAASSLSNINKINTLSDVGFKIYSQFDEDGILEWLIQKVPISSNKFVEFGVENYIESSTRFLLKNRNWKGLIFDSSAEYIDFIHNDEIYWRHTLTAHCTFITPDNINDLLKQFDFIGNIGILSIDAGGMDYWIWKKIDVVTPDIVICEYNAVFGDLYPIAIPYKKGFISRNIHHSGLYWGASTKAFEHLASEKGYMLLGSNIGGNNLFFIRKELYPHIDQLITNKKTKPSLYRDSRSLDGKLTYISGIKRFDEIKHLPVINVETGEEMVLKSLSPVYSKDWLDVI
jgi:hypothetical protein